MLPLWWTYKKRENPWRRILFLSCRIPDRETSWIIIKFHLLIFISSIQECTSLWLYNMIFNFPTSAAQRSRELHTSKTNKWLSKMSQYCITSMVSACTTLSNEQVKIASLPKYCACSFAMPMKINNVSTIRTHHCILRQQSSSVKEQ